MSHRWVDLDGRDVQVFESTIAAMRWAKRFPADCIVVVRGKSVFIRKGKSEMTIRLNATNSPENSHMLSAANNIADYVEKQLRLDRAA